LRRYRNFVRRVRLPEWVEGDSIQAKTKDGVLTITIPKSEVHLKQEVKEIPVSSD
jgi:HSP20 family molecular chaperone IbpA